MLPHPLALRLRTYVATHRRAAWARGLARRCRMFLEWYENANNYDMASNGERFVLEALRPFDLRCVFDVGANVGDWTLLAHRCLPQATVHAFEIMEPTAATLRGNTAGLDRVLVNPIGLADEDQAVTLRYFPEHSALTTLIDHPHPFASITAAGHVVRGDAYVRARGIERIDFLKLDVEGAEDRVLRGLAETFARGAIEMVQFEYGQVNVQTKFLLYDFHRFFAANGFRVGKIYPDHVEFRDYRFVDEDFLGPNYLAIRRERTEVMHALQGS